MCSQVGEQISLELCVSWVGETHFTSDMCFMDSGTHITRDMCFLGRPGDHISLGICVSWVGIVSFCHDFKLL